MRVNKWVVTLITLALLATVNSPTTAQTGSAPTADQVLSQASQSPGPTSVGTAFDVVALSDGDSEIGAKNLRRMDAVLSKDPALDPAERGGVGVAWAFATGRVVLPGSRDDGLLAEEVCAVSASILATSVVRAGSSHRAYDQFTS